MARCGRPAPLIITWPKLRLTVTNSASNGSPLISAGRGESDGGGGGGGAGGGGGVGLVLPPSPHPSIATASSVSSNWGRVRVIVPSLAESRAGVQQWLAVWTEGALISPCAESL